MKLDLNKPMVHNYGVSVEFVRRINDEFCPLLFIVKYQDGGEGALEVGEEGEDKNGIVQIVNTPGEPTTTTYWLVHYGPNAAMFCDKKPFPPFSDVVAVTGPHHVTFRNGDGL